MFLNISSCFLLLLAFTSYYAEHIIFIGIYTVNWPGRNNLPWEIKYWSFAAFYSWEKLFLLFMQWKECIYHPEKETMCKEQK